MSNHSLRQLVAPTSAAVSAAALALLIGATPASARPDAGLDDTMAASAAVSVTSTSLDSSDCPLERIGRHLVRCDSLTGSGAAAPAWVASQSAAAAATVSTIAAASLSEQDMLTKFRRHGI